MDVDDEQAGDLTAAAEQIRSDLAVTADRRLALRRDFDRIVEAAQSVSTDDEHDPEGSTIAFERAQVSALLDQATRHLAELDAAVTRLDDGTWGICERCGEPIPAARLQARPAAARCLGCASRRS